MQEARLGAVLLLLPVVGRRPPLACRRGSEGVGRKRKPVCVNGVMSNVHKLKIASLKRRKHESLCGCVYGVVGDLGGNGIWKSDYRH